ncbi:hypothetical protein [Rufibacter roseolus]|uniref:hypothetical protein n=1 Tax=Rufibacter roseolus TaxID=2817375 RepID=UPI001B3037FE|nr:hypothetical protein [Rufibacter roseolus]
MKRTTILAVVLLCVFVAQLQAQTSPSIVGTWEMLSMTGKNEDGEPINRDVNAVKQYKVITPTHWMYVVKGMVRDTLRMGGGYGTYTLTGNKYVEKLDDPTTTAFTMRVEGDRLFQDGHILLPDGKKVELHEVYRKVNGTPNADKSLVGAWNLVSSYHMENGKRVNDPVSKEFQLITPTHFMLVGRNGEEVKAVILGSYTLSGKKMVPKFILAHPPANETDKIDVTTRIQGDRYVMKFIVTTLAGKVHEWGATYQRADRKPAKAVAGTK